MFFEQIFFDDLNTVFSLLREINIYYTSSLNFKSKCI